MSLGAGWGILPVFIFIMDLFWNDLSKEEEECPVCRGEGLIYIPMFKKGHYLYNKTMACVSCPICEIRGYLKIKKEK